MITENGAEMCASNNSSKYFAFEQINYLTKKNEKIPNNRCEAAICQYLESPRVNSFREQNWKKVKGGTNLIIFVNCVEQTTDIR